MQPEIAASRLKGALLMQLMTSLLLAGPTALVGGAALGGGQGQGQIEVATKLGVVRGSQRVEGGKLINVFLGVPYAQPPIGDLRFTRPRPLTAWPRPYINATSLPNSCHQVNDTAFDRFEGVQMWNPNTEMSEDCLYLNVWGPASASTSSPRAVMVWIYGGGLYSGSATLTLYDGTVLAATGDVVVVSMQYRVGGLGFLYLGTEDAPGNVGLLDQQVALKWVADNIAAFGGDPSRVTIFGESAGAASVGLHLVSETSWPLFHRGILQSASDLSPWAVDPAKVALDKAYALAGLLGCGNRKSSHSDLVACLRKADAIRLTELTWSVPETSSIDTPMVATIDGHFLKDMPAKLNREGRIHKTADLLLGSNLHEGMYFVVYLFKDYFVESKNVSRAEFETAFKRILAERSSAVQRAAMFEYSLPYPGSGLGSGSVSGTGIPVLPPSWTPSYRDLVQDLLGDYSFVCPVIRTANVYSKQQRNKVYMYQFVHRTSANPWPSWMGVLHGYEIDHVFGAPIASVSSHAYSAEEKDLARRMVTYWTNFAKTGDPNKGGSSSLTAWPLYTAQEGQYIVLGASPSSSAEVRRHLRARTCAFWHSLAPQLDEVCSGAVSHTLPSSNDVSRMLLLLLAIGFVLCHRLLP